VTILVKFPTRGRPDKALEVLSRYHRMESSKHNVWYLVTLDDDDPDAVESFQARLRALGNMIVRSSGQKRTKVQAINADMDLASGLGWEVLVLASDDMIPKVQGWDDEIVKEMVGRHAVWLFDGHVRSICTLSIMDRATYESQGYIYHPAYESLWCDNEWTDVANPTFVDRVIIEHEHPLHVGGKRDELLVRNEKAFDRDKAVYFKRKALGFPK
jgi:hypothetical protein